LTKSRIVFERGDNTKRNHHKGEKSPRRGKRELRKKKTFRTERLPSSRSGEKLGTGKRSPQQRREVEKKRLEASNVRRKNFLEKTRKKGRVSGEGRGNIFLKETLDWK